MNLYDKAHELARAMRGSEEYTEYVRLRDIAYEDETNRALLTEYKRLQTTAQVSFASGNTPDAEGMKRMQSIGALLQYNPDASACIMAEFRFQRLLADIYKIIGEAAGLDLDTLIKQ